MPCRCESYWLKQRIAVPKGRCRSFHRPCVQVGAYITSGCGAINTQRDDKISGVTAGLLIEIKKRKEKMPDRKSLSLTT